MTDNEIIKALECHMSKSLDDCEKCPYHAQKRAFRNCHEHLYQDLLFLVNRQRADIDWLFGIVRTYKLRWAKTTAKLDTAKSEAIKMLLTEAKKQAYVSSDWSHGEHPLVIEWDDLEAVAEEMVGADNAE